MGQSVQARPAGPLLTLIAVATSFQIATAQSGIETAFRRFLGAANQQEAAAAQTAVVGSGVGFDEAFDRLRKGRTYAATVPKGVVRLINRTSTGDFEYTLDVPATYEPSRKFQVRVQLHGGVGRPEAATRGDGSIGSLAGDEQIYVLPTSWADAPWWSQAQLDNLRAILDRVKRTYNVDENRIAVAGVSDGGTGAYYVAMRDTTPYAAFLPLNGFIMILANPSLGLSELLFPHNLQNKPFFVVNGGRDQLYPTSVVEPYVRHLQKGGVSLDYHPQPEAGHNTAWWPDVKSVFEAFVRQHPRDPHPARITWESAAGAANRAHYLIVDELAPRGAESPLPDLNEFASGAEMNFGVRTTGMRITSVLAGSNADQIGLKPGDWVLSINGRTLPGALDLVEFLGIYAPGDRLTFGLSRDNQPAEVSGNFKPEKMTRVIPLFPRSRPSGRVDLLREGNTVRVTTRGVGAFTILASPDVFDFSRAITVVANGRTLFSDRVGKSVPTLMKWAALDNDRTMLYGAEVHVRVN
jgi:pimeloyl-ACP methyl ester carboxylesterase